MRTRTSSYHRETLVAIDTMGIAMLNRTKMIAVMTAAVGGPYLASETEWGNSVSTTVGQYVSGDDVPDWRTRVASPEYANHAHYEVEALRSVAPEQYRYGSEMAKKLGAMPVDVADNQIVGSRVADLREVLRFDINDRWVTDRFSRVSTVLADMKLRGLRVPMVTGTRATDLAGTLTYYFDHSGALQRIQIHGFTGDPNIVVDTMSGFYGLQPEPTLEAGVYTKRWNGMPVQFLRLTHAPVVYSDAVHQKYTVFIELNQPNLAYGISDEARKIIAADRFTGRW